MPQFRFPLEKILRWRAIEFAREESELRRLMQEKARLEAMLDRVASERSALAGSVGALPGLNGADLRAMSAYGLRLREHVEKLKENRVRIERAMEVQRRKCAAAKQRLRLLEELKDRRLERWRYEEARQLEMLAAEAYLAGWDRGEP